jgi:hypothetical protein
MVWPPQHKKCKCVIVYKQVMNGFISTFFFSACLSHTPTKIVKNLGFSWLTYYITRSSQQLHIAYFATPFTIVRLVHFIKQNISFWWKHFYLLPITRQCCLLKRSIRNIGFWNVNFENCFSIYIWIYGVRRVRPRRFWPLRGIFPEFDADMIYIRPISGVRLTPINGLQVPAAHRRC